MWLYDHYEGPFLGFPNFPLGLGNVGEVGEGVSWLNCEGIEAIFVKCFSQALSSGYELGNL